MKKWIRYLFGIFAILIILFIVFLIYVHFSVDDRVKLESSIPKFNNSRTIHRLDSIIIRPDSLTIQIKDLVRRANVQGLGISIINNNEIIYQEYFGTRNTSKNESFVPGTIWYGASLSKTIFTDIVLQLEGEKIINLDTPLYTYLAKPLSAYKTNVIQQFFGVNFIDYSDLQNDNRYKKITGRMCLSHTTGLPNWRWLEADKKLKIKFEPGTRYSYSGEGMFLLQFVIEELTGKSFEDLSVEKVFIPLEMERSSYVWQRDYEGNYAVGHDQFNNNLRIPKTNVPNAAGSLSTSLEDYTKFFGAVLKQNEKRYRDMITQQVRIRSKQQFGPNALIETTENDSIQLSYGLGFGLYDTPYGKAFFKEGHLEGWQHYAVGFPSKGTGVIILSNSDQAESIFYELIELTTGNTHTPWFWEGYIPFSEKLK